MMPGNSIIKKLILLFSLVISVSYGDVKLPKLISDGMVLQRDAVVQLRGWADSGEKIKISFIDNVYTTTADDKGEWKIFLPKLKAGGPYEMLISGNNSITIKDILIGDVWVCSGQSNMAFLMQDAISVYEHEIKHSSNNFIRQFTVPVKYDFNTAHNDLAFGKWISADEKSVLRFSAVAYFFAKELYDKYKVPIGLVNASMGGSATESWMSEDALKQFPHYYNEMQQFKDSTYIKQIEDKDKQRAAEWNNLSLQKDEGYKGPGGSWFSPDINTESWDEMSVPGYWADHKLGLINGVVWFRREFIVPSSMVGKPAKLILGRIVDADSVYINRKFVGAVGFQYPPRIYNVPDNLLKEGKNTIVVRIVNNSGKGGFVPGKTYELSSGSNKIDLSGTWKYKLGSMMEPAGSPTFVMWKPGGLYNGMISPIINYTIKGVIWYQGESNTTRSVEQRTLFPALIRNWRDKWKLGDFPFLFVQLPNFNEPVNKPYDSEWALFREAQSYALSEKNTGMAVTIDVGEWNDIHPLNKKDVGKRLALSAFKVAYGDNNVVNSGPIYKSMKVDGNKVIITFDNTGSGLSTKGSNDLKYFSIAGADKKFVWAKAVIKDNKVIVWNDTINKPVAVRYAWADDPEGANLYNKEGLPASPFRTDDF